MRSYFIKWLIALLVVSLTAISADALEIRGTVATGDFTWNPQNFAGFYYDMDKDLGTETLTTTITGDKRLSGDAPYGLTYEADKGVKGLDNAKEGMTYGKLRVSNIDSTAGKITLDNKDNAITLSKNKVVELMPGLFLKTADNDTLRYYIYKNITSPGTYEVRGQVVTGDFTWNPQNFAGLYYDMDHDIGTETITTTLTDNSTLSGEAPYGIIYDTTAQIEPFNFYDFGYYEAIGFMGKKYFAGYMPSNSILFHVSTDENSLADEQLEEILMDEDINRIVKKGESIKLNEGYELILKGVGDMGKIYLNLLKDGKVVDESFISPSKDNPTMFDKTYYYRKEVGGQENLAIIAVHFRTTYKDEENAMAVADGIWQISENPLSIAVDSEFGKMRVVEVDANSGNIRLDNKDNQINLTRKSDVDLMAGIHIRTADNETLRYYLYKMESVS